MLNTKFSNQTDIVIFIPLRKELDYAKSILNKFGELSTFKNNPINYHLKGAIYSKSFDIKICLIEDMGNAPTAAYVSWVLGTLQPRPKWAILAGIAGSLNQQSHPIGSVVVSTSARSIYPNKIFDITIPYKNERAYVFTKSKTPHSDKNIIQVDKRDKIFNQSAFRNTRRHYNPAILSQQAIMDAISNIKHRYSELSAAKKKALDNPFESIKFGKIVSTEYVVDSQEAVDYIIEKIQSDELDIYKQIGHSSYSEDNFDFSPPSAVDMESTGFMHAVMTHSDNNTIVMPIIVRGISDICAQKNDDHQEIASRNAIISALAFAEIFHRADRGE